MLGGAAGRPPRGQIVKVMNMAVKGGMPVISPVGLHRRASKEAWMCSRPMGRSFAELWMSGVVPQLAAVLGPCVGAAAFVPMLGDFSS